MTPAITDFSQFTQLRKDADRNDPAALRAAARQFEALFIQTLLKNMRAGELAPGLFGDSEQLRMYQEMTDQQMALDMAGGRGIGLADMIVRQLGGETKPEPASDASFDPATADHASADHASADHGSAWSDPGSFVRALWPHAERIAKRLAVAPEGIVAQAALETGWGAHVLARADGASSNNLFGIKAGHDWSGESVSRPTLEYADGTARQRAEKFRAYDDIASTFDDYASLIEGDARYSDVQGSGRDVAGFARALQDAGYATDPLYAAKIERVLNSDTMRSALGELKNP